MSPRLSRRHLLAGLAAAPLAAAALSKPVLSLVSPEPLDFTYRGAIRLNSNENALGMSPAAKAALKTAMSETNRYPDTPGEVLTARTAAHLGVKPEHLFFGSGSAEVLAVVTTMAEREGGKIIAPALTFEAVAQYAKRLGVPYETVAMAPGMTMDLDAMEKAALASDQPVVVYLVSPNNPTGTLAASAKIKAWIERAPSNVFFLVDEAYHDYVADPDYESMISMVQAGRTNLVVARTFSKIYALAGLRVGYAVAHPDVLNRIATLTPYGNINVLGMAAAAASIDDTEWTAHSVAQNAKAKAITLDALQTLGLESLPSHTNFVFHRIQAPLSEYQNHMKQAGFLVGRPFGGMSDWNRLSLATPDVMERFAETLVQFRAKGWV